MIVSIIVINYNTLQLTSNCVASVIKHTKKCNYEIIVVDNASTKDNVDELIKIFPDVKLIKNYENSGFAKGNNLGITHAGGDIILLLNSDTILKEDSISYAAKYIADHNDVGALSVKLVYEDGKYQSNARKFRSIRNELLDLVRPLLYLVPYKTRASLMLNQYFKGDMDMTCDWVSGAFIMFRKEVLEKLPGGKLDERYFMYGEDQLWCYQIQQAGFRNYFLSGTDVTHIANASTEPEKQLKLLRLLIGRELDIMKYRKGNSIYYHFFKSIFVVKEMARYYVKAGVNKLTGHRIR